nr:fucose isomerase [uncultured Cohaesibacter sp.]
MRITQKSMTFGLIIGTRNIFNGAMAVDARKEILSVMQELKLTPILMPSDATPHGAVETRADAALYARLFKEKREEIDGILVILPNFGDEIGIIETISQANLGVPIMVQACNDEVSKVDVRSRRDAFCGKISVCNNLYQYGIPFSDTTSHTSDITGAEFRADLLRFAATCRTVKGLKGARIGSIGARTPAFQTVRYSEKLLQASGITVVTCDMSEIIAGAKALSDDDAAVKERVEALHAYGTIGSCISKGSVLRQAKFTETVNRWMAENECDASAIQCWTSIQDNFGCASCATMSMMGEAMMPSACEVDVAGAISMYALTLAANTPSGLLDWNNNYAYEANKCVCTHCSNYPKSFMGNDLEIGNLDVLGTVMDKETCFGAIKGHVAPGPMTFFRLSTDDVKGQIRSYVGEGNFTDDSFGMDGGIAVCEVDELRKLLSYICKNGFEHHVAMVRGNVADVVEDAISNYLKWDLYKHCSDG